MNGASRRRTRIEGARRRCVQRLKRCRCNVKIYAASPNLWPLRRQRERLIIETLRRAMLSTLHAGQRRGIASANDSLSERGRRKVRRCVTSG